MSNHSLVLGSSPPEQLHLRQQQQHEQVRLSSSPHSSHSSTATVMMMGVPAPDSETGNNSNNNLSLVSSSPPVHNQVHPHHHQHYYFHQNHPLMMMMMNASPSMYQHLSNSYSQSQSSLMSSSSSLHQVSQTGIDKWVYVMSAHPDYLAPYLRTHNYILRGDGPLPFSFRHYIALMAAARHENAYLVNRQKSEFLASDGDKRWLQGLEFAPKKLRDLNEINKILAHRPWQITAAHIEKLTKGTEENWSLSEVVHAIVILAHFHALSSFVWSSGITSADDPDDEENMSKNQAALSGVTDDVESVMGAASEVQTQGRKSSAIQDGDDLHPKGINIISNKNGNSIVSVGVNTDPVSVLVGPRTGQDSPPLDPHPGSPPNEASVEVLMQKMKTISQQHSQMTEDDRSPEELQKVFERVEITIPPSTPPSHESPNSSLSQPTQSGLTSTAGLLSSSNVLKEKDPNLVTSCNSMNPSIHHNNHLLHHHSHHHSSHNQMSSPPPATLSANDPHYPCFQLQQQNNINSNNYYHSSNSNSGYNSYSCSPSTGNHYLFGSRTNSLSGVDPLAVAPSPPSASLCCPSPSTCPFAAPAASNDENSMTMSHYNDHASSSRGSESNRFVIDGDFCYTDFARRGEASRQFTTFRVQDYSWDDQGFSLVNQLYNDVGNLLDDKFKVTYNMTYYTMGRKTNVDTSMFRRAIWNYIQCIYGIKHDDYDYREVNELLARDLKKYIKDVCCFPHRVKKEDCDRVMPEFWRSEKIHVNLMISEARMQAALLYALRAVMKFMT